MQFNLLPKLQGKAQRKIRSAVAFLLLCSGIAIAGPSDTTFALGELDTSVEKAMNSIVGQRYGEASAIARTIAEKDSGVACVINGMVEIGRYDDLGDTTALQNAAKRLEKCKSSGFWDALRIFELGYAQNELGHSIKGAMNTRSAANDFKKSGNQDARAFYAIYAYYMDGALSWIPFVSDNRPSHLKALQEAASNSRLFWPLFTTSLAWMHYDREEFAEALKLTEQALRRTPNHPVFLQIKADMLYRLKKFQDAASIYEQSADSYLNRTGKSIRYWCAAANLVRIYADMGNKAKMEQWQQKLHSDEFKAIKNWMPGSLMSDLKKRDLL